MNSHFSQRFTGIRLADVVLTVLIAVFCLVIAFAFHLALAHPEAVTGFECPAVRDLLEWISP